MKLKDHIKQNFEGNQAAFARSEGVKPPQVSQWLAKDIIVVNGKMYSFRRKLNKIAS